ncbi:PspA/IM30 family protein [Pelagimonas varians]|uniref:PspA/IM30 family protein n=1 Tax=Pelagimonas varians TaxID=696760 RepID=A0A238KYZ9_9RHOB|nr:PspA/IM30 family protein [Pelagimonas varians]PYG27590.1 phage shock protein A (PspA) family protein [Pelagimonas varians]SMX47918.1 PspA/IM30 family protein [Pelagimonas varians]
MFGTLKTLIAGANARAEENVRDHYSIELIDQKIREAAASLKAAKYSLASLIQRERAESRQAETLEGKISDLMARAKEAMDGDRADLATQAAQAIAEMENELTLRRSTIQRLETRILQLRQSVETANRRIIDLKQGAIAARAAKKEQHIQKRLNAHVSKDTSFEEAEELIARVLQKDAPFEQGQILKEIDAGLDKSDLADRMADQGFGPKSKSTANDVLARIKSMH